jgi:hypothetical protein
VMTLGFLFVIYLTMLPVAQTETYSVERWSDY